MDFDWDLHAGQFPTRDTPGIHYEPKTTPTTTVDCLLYYDQDEELAGIFYHYNENNLWNRAGSCSLLVREDRRGQWIGSALLRDAWHRWPLTNEQQVWSPEGQGWLDALVSRGKVNAEKNDSVNEEHPCQSWVPRWWDE
jgi:GNAT superfamily N-acetyltransferase